MPVHKGLINVMDYRAAAERALPRMLYDFVAGGALDEQTVSRNRAGFGDWWLRGRSFRSSAQVSLRRDLFGSTLSFPLMLAPTGASGLLWPFGEAETARAAAAKGIVMQVSAGSLQSMEDIAVASDGDKWLQLFLYRDRGLTLEFLERARAAGYRAICVTTDAPVHGRRDRDSRNGFSIDRKLTPATLIDVVWHYRWWLRMARAPRFAMQNFAGRSTGNMVDMAAYISSVLDPDVTWDDFSWLREQWQGPLVVKGVLDPRDAREAVERGADAVQVSNHGGRQLDGTLASIDALPAVVEAVGGRVPVLLDGGISRGTDIVKAVALGAHACVIGRAHLWGLAVAGARGVEAVLDILEQEMRNAMTIGGWNTLCELDRASVARLPSTSLQGERHDG
ncbi:alpha-hydroxy acid oxidase [Nitratireductor alexandrii]|uniref:alpha-hydroxy acid oxidase n=1 Tax=Nitratireductor alexandrii TaxID=2448161 RepID=UPI000FD7986E|nr:alpha-hydroxy acid oxidase [Nitratireductor alexandrii]